MKQAFLVFFSCLVIVFSQNLTTTPEQVHLAYQDQSTIIVTWVTQGLVLSPTIQILPNLASYSANSFLFYDFPETPRTFFVHHGSITNLSPGQNVTYRVGDESGGWSEPFWFKVVNPQNSLSFAIYGDLGLNNSVCLPMITQRTLEGQYDMVIHLGDIAYDLHDKNGTVGDQWFRNIQPIASRVPYQTCPGNHEDDVMGDFYNYRFRFNMPNSPALYYSFDVGNVHFVSFSTESYFSLDIVELGVMYAWLESDLQQANSNRDQTPWIILLGHRPLYCSNDDDQTCFTEAQILREGISILGQHYDGIEILLRNYKVDLYLCGHEHDYERTLPVYQSKPMPGVHSPYTNPEATVHIVTGASGNEDGLSMFGKGPFPAWSAQRDSTSYSYSQVTVPNATHLHWQQIAFPAGNVIDDFWIIKNNLLNLDNIITHQ